MHISKTIAGGVNTKYAKLAVCDPTPGKKKDVSQAIEPITMLSQNITPNLLVRILVLSFGCVCFGSGLCAVLFFDALTAPYALIAAAIIVALPAIAATFTIGSIVRFLPNAKGVPWRWMARLRRKPES